MLPSSGEDEEKSPMVVVVGLLIGTSGEEDASKIDARGLYHIAYGKATSVGGRFFKDSVNISAFNMLRFDIRINEDSYIKVYYTMYVHRSVPPN